MNESDTRLKLIDPAIMKSWDRNTQVFTEYFFTSGEIVVRGSMVSRKDKKKADYLLMYAPGIPIAIVEAKDTEHTVDAGLQQGMGYAQLLDIPFAYSSNGKGFVEHDFLPGKSALLPWTSFPLRRNSGHDTQKLRGLSIRIARRL